MKGSINMSNHLYAEKLAYAEQTITDLEEEVASLKKSIGSGENFFSEKLDLEQLVRKLEDKNQELDDSFIAKDSRLGEQDSRLLELQEEVYTLEQRIIDLNKTSVDPELDDQQLFYKEVIDRAANYAPEDISVSTELHFMTGFLCHTAIICTKALVAAIKEAK